MSGQTAHDELETLYLPRVEKPVPPPLRSVSKELPAPPPLPRQQSISDVVPRRASGVPLALSRGTLVIEMPLSELDENELGQITTWLQARSATVSIRRTRLTRAISAVREWASTARGRMRAAVQNALLWTLSRLGSGNVEDTSGTYARPLEPGAPLGTGPRVD